MRHPVNMGNICSQSNTTSLIYKVMPDLHDQDNSMSVCKILNGELAFPNSKDELLMWNGKLLRMKCVNIYKKNFQLSTIQFFCSICTRKGM